MLLCFHCLLQAQMSVNQHIVYNDDSIEDNVCPPKDFFLIKTSTFLLNSNKTLEGFKIGELLDSLYNQAKSISSNLHFVIEDYGIINSKNDYDRIEFQLFKDRNLKVYIKVINAVQHKDGNLTMVKSYLKRNTVRFKDLEKWCKKEFDLMLIQHFDSIKYPKTKK